MNRNNFFVLLILIFSFAFFVNGNNNSFTPGTSFLNGSKINSNLQKSKKPQGHISYKLVRSLKPNRDELSAYKLIIQVMDSAIYYYNIYSTATKQITVYYLADKTVRADGNFNGNLRFGPDRTFMNVGTATHEISHTLGVGTNSKWGSFSTFYASLKNAIYSGKNATNMLRQITGDSEAIIYMDNQHFWPYGLNYASEYKTTSDVINHCKIVNAMLKDGL